MGKPGCQLPGPRYQREAPAGHNAQGRCLALGLSSWPRRDWLWAHRGEAASFSLYCSPNSIAHTLLSAVKTLCHMRGLQGQSAWFKPLLVRRLNLPVGSLLLALVPPFPRLQGRTEGW